MGLRCPTWIMSSITRRTRRALREPGRGRTGDAAGGSLPARHRHGRALQRGSIAMVLANPQMFISAMDRPIAARRFGRPVLAFASLVLTGLASAGWFTLHPAESIVRLQVSKITISDVTTAPFHDFIPVRGEVV